MRQILPRQGYWGHFLLVVILWGNPAHAIDRLVILHSSEHHGVALPLDQAGETRIGGLARRATIVEEVRREGMPVLMVDSGDILIGTALSSWFRGEPDVRAMNLIRYDAMVAGNHDFDYGMDHLRSLVELADFPILCTNLQSERSALPCRRSVVTRLGNVAVGILGIVGKSNFPGTFNRDVAKGLSLVDPIASLQAEALRLRTEAHIDLVIALMHQDSDEDLKILGTVEGVDVLIGGHTEGFDGLYAPGLMEPVESVARPRSVYVKTHRQGRTIGRLDLTIEDGSVVLARSHNIPVTIAVPVEPKVQQLLNEYRKRFARHATQVLGEASVRLQGDRPVIRTQETNLGNLLADRMRSTLGTDIALINAGQIRRSLEPGPVTLGDVLSVLPFDSALVTLHVTGAMLRQVLEHSVSQWPNHSGRFFQISGLQVTYQGKASVGSRVRSIMVGGARLDMSKTYTVATDAFVADGGDGYDMLSHATHRMDHQLPLRDLLLKALAEGPLFAEVDHRMVFVDGEG
ncbi:MAG: bifunctional metallophosphatase/5'-nucleotidase [Nitrospirales bacterium]|nr:bifunctional metallophosphatase/5'-nucleotidase [Nitrospirales bacterium]MDR4481812.1 bifunctional metallophosphatase/5'-nucleotidase [Nitrospirales bacterium]